MKNMCHTHKRCQPLCRCAVDKNWLFPQQNLYVITRLLHALPRNHSLFEFSGHFPVGLGLSPALFRCERQTPENVRNFLHFGLKLSNAG